MLCYTHHFRKIDTAFTEKYFPRLGIAQPQHYVEIFGDRYFLFQAIRSIFGGSIPLVICNTQYFRGVDTSYTTKSAIFSSVDHVYTKRYAVFSGVGYCLYTALRINFGV